MGFLSWENFARVALALIFCATVANAEPTPTLTLVARDDAGAAAIAEAAFLEHTHHKIKDYSMSAWKHSNTEWHFFIHGEKAFMRPGNDWFITINKQSGAVTIEDGM